MEYSNTIFEESDSTCGNINKGSQQIIFIGAPSWGVSQPFHSLAIVAAVARDAGFEPKVYDLNIDLYNYVNDELQEYWKIDYSHLWAGNDLPKTIWEKHSGWIEDYFENIIKNNNPSIIAFTVSFTTRYFSVFVAKYIKSKIPDIPIMFGGVDCFPKEINKNFLSPEKNSYCDIICQGESEISFRKYLENFKENNDWKTSVQGFAYYNNGVLIDTGDVDLPELKGKLPLPAFDLFDLSQYTAKGSLPFYFSRGCAYKCHFCSERPNFKKYRCREPEEAIEEVKAIIPFARKYADTPTLNLSDSNINVNRKKLERFVDLILENNIKINWGGQAHIQGNMTYEFLERMKMSGLSSIFWGIENGSQHVVDLMNKRYRQEDGRRILNDCNELGIMSHIPIIIGFPGETAEDIVDTIEVIYKFKEKPFCSFFTPALLVVRPNSPLYERYSEFGLANNNYYDWYSSDLKNTLPIRIARRLIVRQTEGNDELTIEKMVDTEEIKNIDLNEYGVASDMFEVINELFSRAENIEVFHTFIKEWAKETFAEYTYKDEYLQLWFQIDKNNSKRRKQLYMIVLAALRDFRDRIRKSPVNEHDTKTRIEQVTEAISIENDMNHKLLQNEAARKIVKLGERLFEEGKHEDATQIFLQIAEIAPENYENRNNLAVAYMHMGMNEKAEVCLKKSISLKDDYCEAHENLKRLHEMKEQQVRIVKKKNEEEIDVKEIWMGKDYPDIDYSVLKKDNVHKFNTLIQELKEGTKEPLVRNYPIEIYMELTKRCNLNCTMCAHDVEMKNYMASGKGDNLDFPGQKFPVFDEILPTAAMVYTVGFGEPLLHKGLVEFVQRCRNYRTFVWTNSNGLALNEKLAEELVDAAVSRFVFSISAGCKESYEQYHKGGKWNRVWKNIEILNAARLSRGTKLPQLFTNFVVMDENLKELPPFVSQTLPFDISGISVKPMVRMRGIENKEDVPVIKKISDKDELYLNEAREISNVLVCEFEDHSYRENYKNSKKLNGICLHPFSTLMVNISGDVYPCGQGETVGGPELILGNIHKRSLMEIWNGESLRGLRKRMIERNYGKGCKECIQKQLCRLHNDTNDTTQGFLRAIDVACSAPAPAPETIFKPLSLNEEEKDLKLWHAPPPEDVLSKIKKRNFYRYMLSMHKNRETVFNTPLEVFLETSNACNLRCVFCATRALESLPSGSSAIMNTDIMQSISSYLPGLASISLHGFGEPLLNKSTIKAAVESVENMSQVDFFTNGVLLNENISTDLVKGKVSKFTVSISSADPEQYERLYARGNYDKLVKNLRFLKAEKERFGTEYPVVTFNTIAMRDTIQGLPELIILAAELGIQCIELKPLVTYPNMEQLHDQRITFNEGRDRPVLAKSHKLAEEFGINLSTSIYEATKNSEAASEPGGIEEMKSKKQALDRPCPLVYRTIYIRSNGKVKPCCFASDDNQLAMGDLTEQTIHEIWNGEKYQALRRAHAEGRVPQVCAHCVEFNLAPPSDAAQYWLENSGIKVYDPGTFIDRISEVKSTMAVLLSNIDKWSSKSSPAQKVNSFSDLLESCLNFLKASVGLGKEYRIAGTSFSDLEGNYNEMNIAIQRIAEAIEPCMSSNELALLDRTVTVQITPQLHRWLELLSKCETGINKCIENAARYI